MKIFRAAGFWEFSIEILLFAICEERPQNNFIFIKNICNFSFQQSESKSKVWAFLLWKSTQPSATENNNLNAWKLYQTWVKLDESVRETWLVAGKTIQSFTKVRKFYLPYSMRQTLTRSCILKFTVWEWNIG